MTIDIATIATVGGPAGFISVLTYVLVNAFISARKDRREDRTAAVTTDAGYIDNTKRVLEIVRAELDRVSQANIGLTVRAERAEATIRELMDNGAEKDRKIDELEANHAYAMRVISQLRGQSNGGTSMEG